MRKKKYGEDTVVIRVPASQKKAVLDFIQRFEVIGNLTTLDSSNPLHDAYAQGYLDCFNQWEEFNHALPFVLTGNEDSVPLVLDFVRGRIPESAHAATSKQVMGILMKSSRKLAKIDSQLEILQKYLDNSWVKVSELANKFCLAKQLESKTDLKQLN